MCITRHFEIIIIIGVYTTQLILVKVETCLRENYLVQVESNSHLIDSNNLILF